MKEALKFLNKPLTIRWYLLNPGYTTACFNPFPIQVVSGNILFAFVTDFLRKKPWAIKRNPLVSFFRIKI